MVMQSVAKNLSFLDRYLAVWIFVPMGLGVAVGYLFQTGVERFNESLTVGAHTNLLIAFGLILMMYPRGARVRRAQSFRNCRPQKVTGACRSFS